MTTVAFLGLGAMGYHMAAHLAKRAAVPGRTLVWNRTRSVAEKHASEHQGAEALKTLEEASAAKVIFCCLPDSEVVASVLENLQPRLQAGSTVVDCTSGDPALTRELAARLEASSCHLVDAPVSGGPGGAKAGSLTTMVGGPDSIVAEVTPLLSTFCKNVKHIGPVGSGHSVKAINNALNTSHLAMAAEGLLALRKTCNVQPAAALGAINTSSGRSLQTEVRLPVEVLSGKFDYGFKVGLMLKDVRIAVSIMDGLPADAAQAQQVSYFRRTEALLEAAVEQEGFDADYTSIVKVLEKRAGIDLREG
eukprot:TRINITY_DN111787_c0_g1_i1.p1 TRINITY_DN111787_c0_g1~~TRINITY_DN111787_c0_g1_i1.p1  ORF type:complete len:306 (-),score=94.00 TRINITY_DN111787_c0_g1_i1:56-973(-)